MRLCIVGTSRCGTTMLRWQLHQHPGLKLFNETHWLPRMFEFAGGRRVDWRVLFDVAAKTTWHNGRDLFSVNRQFSSYADDAALLDAFRAALAARGQVTIQEFSALFAETCFGTEVSWGDKTPDYGFYMGLIQQLWPECRFIHIVRDGVDTARSMSLHGGCQLMLSNGYDNWVSLSYDGLYEKYQPRDLPLAAYVGTWRRRLARIRDEATRLRPGSYLELRYEELQQAPGAVLKQAADWLELETSAEWLASAVAYVRPPREPGAADAEALLYQLAPEDLLYLNRVRQQPGLSLAHDADANAVRDALRRGRDALSAGDRGRAGSDGLSVLATRCGHADPVIGREAVELLLPALRERGDQAAAQHWQAWAGGTAAGPAPLRLQQPHQRTTASDDLLATPKHQDLIYDVGMHKGEDAEFYLRKGFRVVAFEADPDLAAHCRNRLKAFIDSGRLIIEEGAIIAPGDMEPGRAKVRFYKNLDVSVWGTARPEWADRNTRRGTTSRAIEVEAIDFVAVIQQHGLPRYLKIDIEGCDTICLGALSRFREQPDYLSIESNNSTFAGIRREIDALAELGYDRFQAIEQSEIPLVQSPPNPPKEGVFVDHRFEKGSSGLFGAELRGEWKSRRSILNQYRAIFLGYAVLSPNWGLMTPWKFRGVATLRNLARRLLRPVTGAAVPGWYDTHARHSRVDAGVRRV